MLSQDDKRPLYLKADNIESIYFTGPSLDVKMYGKSVQMFPLRRIRSISVIGRYAIDLGVLIIVAQQDIPVYFFSHKGKLLSKISPSNYSINFAEKSLLQLVYNSRFAKKAEELLHEYEQNEIMRIKKAGGDVSQFKLQKKLSKSHKRFMQYDHYIALRDYFGLICETYLQQKVDEFNIKSPKVEEVLRYHIYFIVIHWLKHCHQVLAREKRAKSDKDAILQIAKTVGADIWPGMDVFFSELLEYCEDPGVWRETSNI